MREGETRAWNESEGRRGNPHRSRGRSAYPSGGGANHCRQRRVPQGAAEFELAKEVERTSEAEASGDRLGYGEREDCGSWVAQATANFALRSDGRAGAFLRRISVHGCGPRGHHERRKPGMVPLFASGDETADCRRRGNFFATGDPCAG